MGNFFGPVVSPACRSGILRRASAPSPFAGSTHVLADALGNSLLAVRSDALPLDSLSGQIVTLCGQLQVYFDQGQRAHMLLLATSVQPQRQAGCG